MKLLLRNIFDRCVAAVPPALATGLLKTFDRHPHLAERAGYQVYPKVFYSPFPDRDEIDLDRLSAKRHLPGITIDFAAVRALVERLAPFAAELADFPRDSATGGVEWAMTYPTFDTAALYTMLRWLKPRRYIEVGCGFSTRASSAALRRNREEGHACEALFVEPFPPPHLRRDELPGRFLQQKIQQVPLDEFRRLEMGDVLFIDTSHVLKVQNDVAFELLEVLPSLAGGVHVHVHDIFTPYDYPAEWLAGDGPNRGGNNEQYALECLLSGGRDWEIILPVHALWRDEPSTLDKLWLGAKDRPAAIWLRKR